MWPKTQAAGAYESWRAFATQDLSPEIAGLKGFCLRISREPLGAPAAIRRASLALGLPQAAGESYFTALLTGLGGWAQYARHLQWQAERDGGTDQTITDLLAIALAFEAALHAQFGRQIAEPWRQAMDAHAAPVEPSDDQIIDALLQEAYDRAAQRRFFAAVAAGRREGGARAAFGPGGLLHRRPLGNHPPRAGIARSRRRDAGLRRLLRHRRLASPARFRRQRGAVAGPAEAGLGSFTCDAPGEAAEEKARIGARAKRAWGRFKRAAVSSFAFVEASGPLYLWKLFHDSVTADHRPEGDRTAPRLDATLTVAQRTEMAAAVLRAMSLTSGFARLVLLAGHGARLVNNAHASALQCGACGGFPGDVNARLLAGLLNEADVRAGLAGQGIEVPADTRFVAGLHDTVSDEITLFDREAVPPSHAADLAKLDALLASAGRLARTERALRLPGAAGEGDVARRGRDWAQVRPEWGLAGCKAFIAAPRRHTAGASLAGRAFLHSYDWRADTEFKVLELILTAPVVVASWISLQYYGSAVAPAAFGAGNKLLHNVVGGIGVFEGNGGLLRGGLPWQSVHDGERLMHEPVRLSVVVAAPREAILGILAKHPDLRALFDQGWLALFAMDDSGQVSARYRAGDGWIDIASTPGPAALAA